MRLILGIRCIRQVKSPHTVCACHHGYVTLASVSIIGCVNLTGIITLAPEPADGVKTAMSGTLDCPVSPDVHCLIFLQADTGLPCVTFSGKARVCLTGW